LGAGLAGAFRAEHDPGQVGDTFIFAEERYNIYLTVSFDGNDAFSLALPYGRVISARIKAAA
jgi:hypothetical protein